MNMSLVIHERMSSVISSFHNTCNTATSATFAVSSRAQSPGLRTALDLGRNQWLQLQTAWGNQLSGYFDWENQQQQLSMRVQAKWIVWTRLKHSSSAPLALLLQDTVWWQLCSFFSTKWEQLWRIQSKWMFVVFLWWWQCWCREMLPLENTWAKQVS